MAKGSKSKVPAYADKPAAVPSAFVKAAAFFSKPVIHLLVIVVLGLLVYSNTFFVPFQFDDFKTIVNNSGIKDFRYFSDSSLAAKDHLTNFYQGRYVGYLSFALNYRMHGLQVAGYHVINLMIHVLSALLVYWLVVLTIRTPYASDRFQENTSGAAASYRWVPWVAALLFVSHPIQTQAVTFIVQRFTSLATLFYLLSLVAYINARGSASSKRARWACYAVSLISAVLAMRTKEIAFTLPLMIVLYEWMFLKGEMKKRLLYISPFLLTLLIIPLTLLAYKGSPGDVSGIEDDITRITGVGLSRWDYLNTQFRVIVTYIRLLLFPINQNLDYDYPLYNRFLNPEVLLSFMFLSALFGLGIYLFYKSYRAEQGNRFWLRFCSLGIFWFFVTLSVESSIIPITDVIFEHRIYLPSVGFFMALVAGVVLIKEKLSIRNLAVEKALAVVMILLVFALSVTAYARNMVWQDEETLWKDVIKKSPDKARPYYNLGGAYINQGRTEDAVDALQTVIKLGPSFAFAAETYYNLGVLYQKQGRLDDALRAFQTTIKIKPGYSAAHYNLGLFYQNQGRFDDAIGEYRTAITLMPNYVEALNNLGVLYQNLGRLDEAIAVYEKAIRLKPEDAELYNNIGVLYRVKNLPDEALRAYKTAIKLKPDYAEAYNNLGLFYQKNGRLNEAIQAYQQAIKLNPDYAEAYNNLGAAHFSQDRLNEAFQAYRTAQRLKPDYYVASFNLGVLYLKQGRLDEAHREFENVLKVNPNHKDAQNNLEYLRRVTKSELPRRPQGGASKKTTRWP